MLVMKIFGTPVPEGSAMTTMMSTRLSGVIVLASTLLPMRIA